MENGSSAMLMAKLVFVIENAGSTASRLTGYEPVYRLLAIDRNRPEIFCEYIASIIGNIFEGRRVLLCLQGNARQVTIP